MVTRRAFSLVELLTVIAIIATLAALVVAGANALGIGSKAKKTMAILGGVRTALELTVAEKGSLPNPVEHPLAGSRPPRAIFVRAGSGPLPVDGEALAGLAADQVAADARPRLLAADDRFADPDLPLLCGLPRARIGVLGAPLVESTGYRRLPVPLPTDPDRILDGSPYTAVGDVVPAPAEAPTWTPDKAEATLGFVLAAGSTRSELARLGALRAPPDDLAAARIRDGRVWSPQGQGATGDERWKPGRVRDGSLSGGKPNWKEYRLRGLAITDAWGIELLYSVDAAGALRLMSPGADGVFHIAPGDDHLIDSDLAAWPLAVDARDRDGQRDNLVVGVGE